MATPHYTRPDRSHGGSSKDDIQNEPEWVKTHNHRIGFRDRNDRHPGHTHIGDEWNTEQEREFLVQAKKETDKLNTELEERDLINIRDFMTKQEVRMALSLPCVFGLSLIGFASYRTII